MTDNRNTILAVILSGLVLIAWQYFYNVPQMEKQRAQSQTQAELAKPRAAGDARRRHAPRRRPGSAPSANAPAQPASRGRARRQPRRRDRRHARASRSTRRASTGSISLKGARIDDLSLVKFRETVDPTSPAIVLYLALGHRRAPITPSSAGSPAAGSTARIPDQNTVWQQEGSGSLSPSNPVTLKYDNGEGLTFRRTIAIDDRYLFTIKDDVTNVGNAPVTLYPFALISRHGTPQVSGYYILHEGLIGYLGDQGLQEYGYKKIDDAKSVSFKRHRRLARHHRQILGLGAAARHQRASCRRASRPTWSARSAPTRPTICRIRRPSRSAAPAAPMRGCSPAPRKPASSASIFRSAGLGGYNKQLGLNHFDLLIDWGWFYFITKPMFLALDFFYHLVGNFGIAILLVTVLVKLLFFPLANKSYASMAKMKSVQPQLAALKERYPDDKEKQQQEMMEIYKKEKINPIAGCLPVALQIPVFFSLYKVLFVTIEMRHAPFYGWIKDLSAPDPTNLFNLFGLLHFDPTQLPVFGHYLALGVWPIIMGITMWFQMKLNPTPPDPTQQMIFDWMPLIFTFMLAGFPAGLVIYWAWNNTLSVLQQSFIMRRNGVKVELFDNLKATFASKKAESKT